MQLRYITFSEAARLCPGSPAPHTVWRWARRGLRTHSGEVVKLEHIQAGQKLFTTEEWLERFFRATAQANAAHFTEARPERLRPVTNSVRRRESRERAERRCRDAGV